MKKKLLKPLLVSVLGLSTLSATISCSCGRKEDVKPADNKKDVVTPIETPIKREYDSVKLPELPEAEKRFKSIRMSLKDLTFTVSNVPAKYNQYSNKVEKATVVYEAKLSDAEKTVKVLEFNSQFYATYKADTQKLELKGNVSLPQQATVNGKEVNIAEYTIKQVKLENQTYNLDQPITGNPNESVVNILDVYAKDKKVYIEFNGDISEYKFYLRANKNGNSSSELKEEALDWEVVKREGSEEKNVLEVRLNEEHADGALYAQLNKIILKKDDYYHLYLFHAPYANNDSSKIQIKVKDDLKLVKLPEAREESKRTKNGKQIITNYTGEAPKGTYEGSSTTVERKYAKMVLGIGDPSEPKPVKYSTSERGDIIHVLAKTDKIAVEGAHPVPATYEENGRTVEVEKFFVKSVIIDEKEYIFDAPVVKNAKEFNRKSPSIIDTYVIDNKLYVEFDKNIKSKMFNISFLKDGNPFDWTNDEDVEFQVVTKEGSDIENTILQIWPTSKLSSSDTRVIKLLRIVTLEGTLINTYTFNRLGNDSKDIEIKLKDN
ncbi:hypothetical protein [Mycoplasmopsis edwardii]|uniref:Uncharacterized protein n=1 Tax=Mycoplasmopsis edwardii TaxID=53558 RepID=A0ACD4PGL6_9BACT|nr:hypothetical protein [Mycoplasmopsis edwardii]WBP83767.1 hypothetical protein Me_995_000386 [Mycoplasmopsis edwardii]